jgi:hypothetical protein
MHLQIKIALIRLLALAYEKKKETRAKYWMDRPAAYEAHKQKMLANYWKNRDQKLQYQNQWAVNNRGRNLANAVSSMRKRSSNDPRYSISTQLNHTVAAGLMKRKTSKVFESLVGCSMADAKRHFEKLFHNGMTWENYGRGGWEIDHKLPWKQFDLTDKQEQNRCYHITNLQPLWKADNIRKRDSIQPSTTLTT